MLYENDERLACRVVKHLTSTTELDSYVFLLLHIEIVFHEVQCLSKEWLWNSKV
jgi:hypothetical protein